jgi:hypothetical protein
LGQVLYLRRKRQEARDRHRVFLTTPCTRLWRSLSLQSLYHFTIGGPVEDRRLMTPPTGTSSSTTYESRSMSGYDVQN